jgi:hypothetical protein
MPSRSRSRFGVRGEASIPLALVLGGSAVAGLVLGGLLGFFGLLDLTAEPELAATAATATYYDCPNGAASGRVTRGDRVYITGRDADGSWIQVRDPRSVQARVWLRAAHVLPDEAIDGLPVLSCGLPVTAFVEIPDTTTSSTQATTTTTEAATTTAATTTTTQVTTTAPPADTTGPAIGNAAATPTQIWESDGSGISCPTNTPRQATISAAVSDPGGVAAVTASWTDPGGNRSVGMTGSAGIYSVTIGPYVAGVWDPSGQSPYDHVVVVTITARDAAGNTSATTVQFTVIEIWQCFG